MCVLAAAPPDYGPQEPLDSADIQKTSALQRTGVYPKHIPQSYLLINLLRRRVSFLSNLPKI